MIGEKDVCHNFVSIGCPPWEFISNEQPGFYITFTEYQTSGGKQYILFYHFDPLIWIVWG